MLVSLGSIGYTVGVIGEVLIAYTVLKVHDRFLQEHMVDRKVLKEMKKEQIVAFIALAMIIAGYVLKVVSLEFHL
ncbi:hypothetical protein KKC60_01960 [Patescibacteria group bacterium]|nr:hypothetical protein [Patescibacteria group bacterium]